MAHPYDEVLRKRLHQAHELGVVVAPVEGEGGRHRLQLRAYPRYRLVGDVVRGQVVPLRRGMDPREEAHRVLAFGRRAYDRGDHVAVPEVVLLRRRSVPDGGKGLEGLAVGLLDVGVVDGEPKVASHRLYAYVGVVRPMRIGKALHEVGIEPVVDGLQGRFFA